MKLIPKKGILVIKKHNNTALKEDISLQENDEDKRLITGEVIEGNNKGQTVIFGRYAILKLTVQGEDYFLLDEEDVIGTCDYKENV